MRAGGRKTPNLAGLTQGVAVRNAESRKLENPLPAELEGGFNDGGAARDRTADLLNAIQALSQLSYSPIASEGNVSVEACGRQVRKTRLFFVHPLIKP